MNHIRLFTELAISEDPALLKKAAKGTYGINPEFEFSDQSDLVDSVKSFMEQTKNERFKAAGRTVIDYYMNEVLIYAANSHNRRLLGASVYLPISTYRKSYDTLRFAKDSGWGRLIKAF